MSPDAGGRQGPRHGWLPAFAGVMVARLFTNQPMIIATFSALMIPLAQATGAERGVLSLALSAHLICIGLGAPLYGFLIDRFGVRRVLVPCLIATGALLASLSFSASLWVILGVYFVTGLFGAAAPPTGWAKIVTLVVRRRQGLALSAITTTGGVAGAVMPVVAAILIERYGWQGAYVWLGALMVVGTVPILLFVTPDSPRTPRPASDRDDGSRSSFLALLRRKQLWALIVPAVFIALAVSGKHVHFIPMLVDQGETLRRATAFNIIPNMTLIIGALTFGYFLDRMRPAVVGTILCLVSAAGYLMMSLGSSLLLIVGSSLAGCAGGAEVGLIAYTCTRYFAPQDFGKVNGILFLAWTVGQSLGASIFGFDYELNGSYLTALLGCALALALSPLSLAFLGPCLYPATPDMGASPVGHSSGETAHQKGSSL